MRAVPAAVQVAVGVVDGAAVHLRLYGADGTQVGDIDVSDLSGKSLPTFAIGDVTGDGTPDIVVGSGASVANRVRVYDGATLQAGFTTSPFGAFNGGVNVSVGDISGDGTADIVVSPGMGGGPRVVAYRGGDFAQILNFFAIDSKYMGGISTAVGDVNRDGHPDLIVAAGSGGGPRVAIYDGASLATGSPTRLVNDFFAFDSTLRTGVNVAVGDVNGDGFADLVFGAGSGGGPRVLVVSGQTLMNQGAEAAMAAPLANFFSGDSTLRTGVQVSIANLNGDADADVVTGTFLGAGGGVTAYDGAGLLDGSLSVLFNLTAPLAAGALLPGLTTPVPVPPAAPGALVTLNLNPLDINLLGVEIQTSPITVTVSAQSGDGLLLGNTLTLASHLVNLPAVSDALNNVLGNVVTLLNSASMAVSGVGSGTFDTATADDTPVLDLFVAPVHVNLLGALVDTSPIHLTITAHLGAGLVLGNAVTALANLFNPPLPAHSMWPRSIPISRT